ncbi:MAG: GNAT family N-acetyltransferase [Verrucomicrobiota bacterium]
MRQAVSIRPLAVNDALSLCQLMEAQAPSYIQFFTPFPFEVDHLTKLLARRKRDVWMALRWQNKLIGFFLLRGWDEGFDVPSYGIMIDEAFTGYGFGRLSLRVAKSIAMLRQAPRLMLKVHPQNHEAKRLFENEKFKRTGLDSRTGNLIYAYELPRRTKQR